MTCFFFSRSSAAVALFLLAASFSIFAEPTLDKLIADKKYKEAIDYAEDKVPPGQRDAATWVELAQANEAVGVPEKALACYLVALRLDQNNYQALLGAATLYNQLEQPEAALNLAKKALDKNFTARFPGSIHGRIALNRSVEAKARLEKVIQGDSGNVIANKELGNIYYNNKEWQKALPLLKKSYQKSPDGGLAYKIGKAYAGAGTPDSAITYMKEAISRGGAPDDAGLLLARALFAQGSYADASAQYGKLAGKGMEAIDYNQAAVAAEKSNMPRLPRPPTEKAVTLFGTATGTEALLSQVKVAAARMEKKEYAPALANYQFVVAADRRRRSRRHLLSSRGCLPGPE